MRCFRPICVAVCFRIACNENCDFISHSCDGHESLRHFWSRRNNAVTNEWEFAGHDSSNGVDFTLAASFPFTQTRPRRRPEQDQCRDQLRDRRHCRRHALSFVARHRRRQIRRRAQSAIAAAYPDRRRAGRRRLRQSHLLRPVRAAHDRQIQDPAAGRRLRKLHQLHDRSLARRGDADLRPGAVPRLLVLES